MAVGVGCGERLMAAGEVAEMRVTLIGLLGVGTAGAGVLLWMTDGGPFRPVQAAVLFGAGAVVFAVSSLIAALEERIAPLPPPAKEPGTVVGP